VEGSGPHLPQRQSRGRLSTGPPDRPHGRRLPRKCRRLVESRLAEVIRLDCLGTNQTKFSIDLGPKRAKEKLLFEHIFHPEETVPEARSLPEIASLDEGRKRRSVLVWLQSPYGLLPPGQNGMTKHKPKVEPIQTIKRGQIKLTKSAGSQTHLDPTAPHTHRLYLSLRCSHPDFHKLTGLRITQPLLPFVELPLAQTALPAERCHALATATLFAYQSSPLRPYLCILLTHSSTVTQLHAQNKMPFA